MRAINTSDVFKLARLIKSADIKDVLLDAMTKGQNMEPDIAEDDPEEIKEQKLKDFNLKQDEFGLSVILDILYGCVDSKQEKAIYELLAGITEKSAKEIEAQPFNDTVEDIKQILAENDVMAFFRSALNVQIS